ncbi:MAG: exodeoxyribonuclease VII small subunit [Phycisphaerales bacterium]|nr:exodeoxyribonuclease VII small subunit [Phycisphaerales bacterium]
MAAKTSKKSSAPDPASLSFEAAMEELELIMDRIERGEIGLEESLSAYARGEALLKACKAKLDASEQKVEELSAESLDDDDGGT